MARRDRVDQRHLRQRTATQRLDLPVVIGPHFDHGVTMPGVEPEQILRDTDLIVRISDRAEHILLTGGGGKNRVQHLLDAGFSDTAGHRRKPERGKPHAVHPRERLIGAQRIFRKQHRNRTIRGNFLPFPLRDAEGAATGRDCRIEKVVRIELLPGSGALSQTAQNPNRADSAGVIGTARSQQEKTSRQ